MSLTIYLSPEEVARRCATLGIPCTFTPEDLKQLETTPVVDRPFRVLGFPIPWGQPPLTISLIKSNVGTDPKRQPCIFDHPWYLDEPFMKTACEPGWHFLGMDVSPESINQTVNYEGSLPSAVEVVLMLFLHYVGTGEQLLLKKHTWCRDRASMDRQVTVGAFGRNGVFLSGHPAGYASRGLGVCPKIV
jgi:hypothetical protein